MDSTVVSGTIRLAFVIGYDVAEFDQAWKFQAKSGSADLASEEYRTTLTDYLVKKYQMFTDTPTDARELADWHADNIAPTL